MPFVRITLSLTVLFVLQACGSTLHDVPRLSAQQVQFRGLPALSPPSVSLMVLDERPRDMRDNQRELEQMLRELLVEVLEAERLTVADAAPHALTVRVRQKAAGSLDEFDPERCVALSARLEQSHAYFVEATGTGCHHLRHALGFTVGGDISEAYRVALGELLRGLNTQLQVLPADPQASASEPPQP